VEVKFSDAAPSPNWKRFAAVLPCKLGLQIMRRPGWQVHTFGESRVLVAGAAEALMYFA
jgi:hypothetical protein